MAPEVRSSESGPGVYGGWQRDGSLVLYIFVAEDGQELLPGPLPSYAPLYMAIREPLLHRLGTSWSAFQGLRFEVVGGQEVEEEEEALSTGMRRPPPSSICFSGDALRASRTVTEDPVCRRECGPSFSGSCPGRCLVTGVLASILAYPLDAPLIKHFPPPLLPTTATRLVYCRVTVTLLGRRQDQLGPPKKLVNTLLGHTYQIDPLACQSIGDMKGAIQQQYGLPMDQQRIVVNKQYLADDGDAVREGVSYCVVIRMAGGICSERFVLWRTCTAGGGGGSLEGHRVGDWGDTVFRFSAPTVSICIQLAHVGTDVTDGVEWALASAAQAFLRWEQKAEAVASNSSSCGGGDEGWSIVVEWIRLFKEAPSSAAAVGARSARVWHAHELLPALLIARRRSLPPEVTHHLADWLAVPEGSWLQGGLPVQGNTEVMVERGGGGGGARDLSSDRIVITFKPSSFLQPPRGALLRISAPFLEKLEVRDQPNGMWTQSMGGQRGEHATWYALAGERGDWHFDRLASY